MYNMIAQLHYSVKLILPYTGTPYVYLGHALIAIGTFPPPTALGNSFTPYSHPVDQECKQLQIYQYTESVIYTYRHKLYYMEVVDTIDGLKKKHCFSSLKKKFTMFFFFALPVPTYNYFYN